MTPIQRKYLTRLKAQFGPHQPKVLTLWSLIRPAIVRGAVLVGLAILIRHEYLEWSMFAAGAALALVARQFWWAKSTINFAPLWSQIIDWKEVDRLLEYDSNRDATDVPS